jgi:hypothetical protein
LRASFVLESGDDLLDRLVLLCVVPFIPPHDEVGSAGAERRHGERRGESNDLLLHSAGVLIRNSPDTALIYR